MGWLYRIAYMITCPHIGHSAFPLLEVVSLVVEVQSLWPTWSPHMGQSHPVVTQSTPTLEAALRLALALIRRSDFIPHTEVSATGSGLPPGPIHRRWRCGSCARRCRRRRLGNWCAGPGATHPTHSCSLQATSAILRAIVNTVPSGTENLGDGHLTALQDISSRIAPCRACSR